MSSSFLYLCCVVNINLPFISARISLMVNLLTVSSASLDLLRGWSIVVRCSVDLLVREVGVASFKWWLRGMGVTITKDLRCRRRRNKDIGTSSEMLDVNKLFALPFALFNRHSWHSIVTTFLDSLGMRITTFSTFIDYKASDCSTSLNLFANRGIWIQMHRYYSLPHYARCMRWDKHMNDFDLTDKHVGCWWSLLPSYAPMCQTKM